MQGLDPKTVGLLHSSLGIKTIEALKSAGRAGRLGKLRGLGAKKQELILQAIDERHRRSRKHLITDAQTAATAVIDHLRATCSGGRFHAVGSLRRGCDTCGDVDILAVDINPAVHDSFITFFGVDRILGHGDTKLSILLRDGMQVDLRLVTGGNEGAALQYFTGSKLHNIALRDRAIRLELKLNEHGLFRVSDGTKITVETEVDVYEALRLRLLPPELLENRDEIGAAASSAQLSEGIFIATLRPVTVTPTSRRCPRLPELRGSIPGHHRS